MSNTSFKLFAAASLFCCAAFSFHAQAQAQDYPSTDDLGAPRQLTLPPHASEVPAPRAKPKIGASVLPNGRSCPLGNPAAALSSVEANRGAIEDLPGNRSATNGVGASFVLGTGTGCPPTAADIRPTRNAGALPASSPQIPYALQSSPNLLN